MSGDDGLKTLRQLEASGIGIGENKFSGAKGLFANSRIRTDGKQTNSQLRGIPVFAFHGEPKVVAKDAGVVDDAIAGADGLNAFDELLTQFLVTGGADAIRQRTRRRTSHFVFDGSGAVIRELHAFLAGILKAIVEDMSVRVGDLNDRDLGFELSVFRNEVTTFLEDASLGIASDVTLVDKGDGATIGERLDPLGLQSE